MKHISRVVVYEHPEYGEARAGFSWKKLEGCEQWVWKVDFVEFDFFTPPEEQERLIDALRVRGEVNRVPGGPEAADGGPPAAEGFLMRPTPVSVNHEVDG